MRKKISSAILFTLFSIFYTLPQAWKSLTETPDSRVLFGIPISGSFINYVSMICCILIVFVLFLRICKNVKDGAGIAKDAADNMIAATAILITECEEILNCGALDNIINQHRLAIENYIDGVQLSVRLNIDRVIDEDFLDRSLDALTSKKREREFQPVIAKAYNDLAGLSEIENFVKSEVRKAQQEIQAFVLKWLRKNDINKYLQISVEVREKISEFRRERGAFLFFWFNPKLKDIIVLDYEREVLIAAGLIPLFQIVSAKVTAGIGITSLASVGGFLTGLGVDDFHFHHELAEDTINNHIHDEIGNHLVQEVLEYGSMAIPYIGFAFMVLKVVRYYGLFKSFIDRSEKLRQMRENVARGVSQMLDYITDCSTTEIEISSLKLVAILEERFKNLQDSAMKQAKWAAKFTP